MLFTRTKWIATTTAANIVLRPLYRSAARVKASYNKWCEWGKELWDFVGAKFDFLKRLTTELYILRSELSQHKLSLTLATAHFSSPDNAIGLVAQCKLSGHVKLG